MNIDFKLLSFILLSLLVGITTYYNLLQHLIIYCLLPLSLAYRSLSCVENKEIPESEGYITPDYKIILKSWIVYTIALFLLNTVDIIFYFLSGFTIYTIIKTCLLTYIVFNTNKLDQFYNQWFRTYYNSYHTTTEALIIYLFNTATTLITDSKTYYSKLPENIKSKLEYIKNKRI